MYSRAHLLILRDFERLKEDKLWRISVELKAGGRRDPENILGVIIDHNETDLYTTVVKEVLPKTEYTRNEFTLIQPLLTISNVNTEDRVSLECNKDECFRKAQISTFELCKFPFKKYLQQGIEAYQLKDDNVFEWTAKILGLKGTLWEGGVLRIYIKFDEHYNMRPPQVCFHTIPFHPNVDMITGKPCIDFLDDWSQWKESYSLSNLLLSIQVMLSNPVLENAVNLEAVDMLVSSPHSYKQMVLDCVAASKRVEAGLVPHMVQSGRVQIASLRPQKTPPAKATMPATAPQRRARIAFEDYYTTWRGIATSKSTPDSTNPLLEAIKENPALQAAHYCLPVKDIQTQMEQQLQEQSQLVYGKFKDNSLTEAQLKEAKLEKVNQMRKIYMRPKTTSRRTPISLYEGVPENTRVEEEHWEEEVDNLVAWTNDLNADAL